MNQNSSCVVLTKSVTTMPSLRTTAMTCKKATPKSCQEMVHATPSVRLRARITLAEGREWDAVRKMKLVSRRRHLAKAKDAT